MLQRILPSLTLDNLYLNYLEELRSTVFSGEISLDYATRLTVATDNSIYQVIPQAVIFPRNTDDIVIALKISQRSQFQSIKFSPRGGGTGTNGQSLSSGIIIDCSKYMRNILEINLTEQWVRVQAGVILDQLNQFLYSKGFHFAPEISPSNRATLGGMINTDACGIGSKIIGRTSDHVLDLTCILASGEVLHTSSPSKKDFSSLTNLLKLNQKLIEEKCPDNPRMLNGYNLKKAYEKNLNLNYLLCGSEGTLGIISECKLKLTPLPKFKKLIVVKYKNFNDALRFNTMFPNVTPLVIETIDEKLISLARNDALYWQIKQFIEPAEALNLVEFVADTEEALSKNTQQLINDLENNSHTLGYYVAQNDLEIKLLWDLRKKSVGLISKKQQGTRRPIPFIEDTAVPPQFLADYISEFKKVLDNYSLVYGMYGHVDAGCVHVRPALDLKNLEDEKLLRKLSDEVVALVKKYQGVMWGEHGKGFRSEYTEDFFGKELYYVLREIKTFFDPYNQLNPGKIVSPLNSTEKIVSLETSLRAHLDKQIPQIFAEQYANPLACNGNGACFNFSTQDIMCPSFKVTNNRVHSPKGRATIIREWLRLRAKIKRPEKFTGFFGKITNKINDLPDFSHDIFHALNGCLSCKACANQCPLKVDVPEFKAQFLEIYYTRFFRPWRDFFIAKTESIAKLQATFPRFSNWFIKLSFIRTFTENFLKLVDLPETQFRKNKFLRSKIIDLNWQPKISDTAENSIILIQDAFTSFYEPNILLSAYHFFQALGLNVYIAPFFQNGKPLHVKGFLKKFKEKVEKNSIYLQKLAAFGIPLLGLDPSITLTYRDEYKKILGNKNLNFEILLPQEWLMKNLHLFPKFSSDSFSNQTTFYYISHCTEKTSHTETDQEWQIIFATLGLKLIPLPAGCCGMAGSYGHEIEHIANSEKLFEMDWKNYLNQNPNQIFLATGYSCRSQAKRLAKRILKHPLEILTLGVKHEL